MEKQISEKRKQILSVQELLENSKLSDEKYDSTKEPFFMKHDNDEYVMNYKDLPQIPESLNRHIKIFYTLVGNPDVEVYIGDYTFMSLNKCLEDYKHYCDDNQHSVFDIAFRYEGMGHVTVISCDLNNHLLFERSDGGSNGYDREDNYKALLNYKTGDKKYMYFVQFKEKVMENLRSVSFQ
ncbi:MAG: hypothetical protein CMK44_00990 [Porticoccus sp.]|nr:hypothetical protein [Porticoccus sp.]